MRTPGTLREPRQDDIVALCEEEQHKGTTHGTSNHIKEKVDTETNARHLCVCVCVCVNTKFRRSMRDSKIQAQTSPSHTHHDAQRPSKRCHPHDARVCRRNGEHVDNEYISIPWYENTHECVVARKPPTRRSTTMRDEFTLCSSSSSTQSRHTTRHDPIPHNAPLIRHVLSRRHIVCRGTG